MRAPGTTEASAIDVPVLVAVGPSQEEFAVGHRVELGRALRDLLATIHPDA
jgi:hypothetical protein